MSRRKQSNPKFIKVSSDSPEAEGTDKEADIRDEVLPDTAEAGSREAADPQMRSQDSGRGSAAESADSPDHIDVVSTCHSPPPSPPAPLPAAECRRSPPSMGGPPVAVKVEKEDAESAPCGRSGEEEGGGNPGALTQGDSSSAQGLVRHLQLPSDVLYLKEVEMMVHGTPTASWMICSAIPLPKGSSLGPFTGHMVSSDNIRVGNLILEFHSKTGHVVLVNVAGQSGAWLALLRPADSELSRNALVYLEGGRIWCEIVSDVEIGMELRATFVFDLDDLSLADRELSLPPVSPTAQNAPDRTASGSSPPSQPTESAVLQQPSPGHAALIYGCPFCGVRFSSPRTLQGHLSYYCSKKKAEHIVSPRPRSRRSSDCQGGTSVPTDMACVKQEQDADVSKKMASSQQPEANTADVKTNKRSAPPSDSNSSTGDGSPPPAKVSRVDGPSTVQCPLCSYCADKPSSLNRHMRIHNRQPEPTVKVKQAAEGKTGSKVGGSAADLSATYCKECNIQFSNMSTYQCHKTHYCSQRNMGRISSDRKQESPQFGMPTVPAMGMPGGMSAASLQLATLGQNGLLFPPGHGMAAESSPLPTGATMMPGGQAAVILTAPVMTPTGITSMAIPLSTVLQSIQAAAAVAAASSPVSPVSGTSPQKPSSPKALDTSPRSGPEEAHQNKSPKRPYSSDTDTSVKELPLDLSTKKSDLEDCGPVDKQIKREKEEDRSPGSAAPSLTRSSPVAGRSNSTEVTDLPCGSAAPKTSSNPVSMAGLPPHLLSPSLLPPFLPLPNMAALPIKPPAHPFGGMPPGSSKCTDCNIIFYKHDNFLIHKQHYCSGKKLRAAATSLASPRAVEAGHVKPEPSSTVTSTPEQGPSQSPQRTTSPGNDPEPTGSESRYVPPITVKPPLLGGLVHAPGEDVFYKFLCIPCKIKFSTATNLKAHKEYYCPHGKNSEHTIIAQKPSGEIISTGSSDQQSPNSNGSSPSPGQYCCTQCRATFTSSRLLKLHLCSTEVAQVSVLKCSHCDYVTHTDKRLAEHMKVHNPTSAYRCTLCGYRGNTVRGMRMHGKTHTDNGEDFTDDHMIEFQEPPLVPIQTNSDFKGAQGPFSVEAELLRLKNEPYKRRRSRKAYEKVDIFVPLDDPQSCHLCGECFPDPRSLVLHLRIHEMSNQYMQELTHCNQCDYVNKSVEEMRAHMEIAHGLVPWEEKENHPQSASPERRSPFDRKSFERESSTGKKSPLPIKEEPLDNDADHSNSSGADPTRQVNGTPTDSFRGESMERNTDNGHPSMDRPVSNSDSESKSEEIDVGKNSNHTESVQVKVEPELDRDEDSCNDPPLPITFATSTPASQSTPTHSAPSSPQHRPSHSSSPTSPASSPAHSTPSIKVEPDLLAHSLGPAPHALFPRFFVAPVRPVAVGGSSQDRKGLQGRGGDSASIPYCKNCDISFTYHSTFIAHKKYYCTERTGVPSSATA